MNNEIFAPVEFPYDVCLEPRHLHAGMYKLIEANVVKELSGVCRTHIGFIKPGSVRIVKKQLGQVRGSHTTGNVAFTVQVRCLATMPVKGQVLACSVVAQNASGICAKNFRFPYILFISKDPTNPNIDQLERIQLHQDIQVTVQDVRYMAPSVSNPESSMWVICDLTSIDVNEMQHKELQKIRKLPAIYGGELIPATMVDSSTLTDGAGAELKQLKDKIRISVSTYPTLLRKPGVAAKDPLLQSYLFQTKGGPAEVQYTVGTIEHIQERPEPSIRVTVIVSTEGKKEDSKVAYKMVSLDKSLKVGDLILHTPANGDKTREAVHVLDLWDNHVRLIINPYELIHPPKAYENFINYVNYKYNKRYEAKRVRRLINRAYLKMAELCKAFPLLPAERNCRIFCIAEAPGGFIQSIVDQRVGTATKYTDTVVGMSISTNSKGPWQLLADKLTKNRQVHVNPQKQTADKYTVYLIGGTDKDDGTGDIMINNMQYVDEAVATYFPEGQQADLITADGGAPFDAESYTHEVANGLLIFAEAIAALKAQAPGGTFVVKVYDLATDFMASLMSVLSYCYETVSLFKAVTSRPANSEKYVICQNLEVKEEERQKIIVDLMLVYAKLQQANTEPDSLAASGPGAGDDGADEPSEAAAEGEEVVIAPKQYMGSFLVAGVPPDMREALIHYNRKYIDRQKQFILHGYEYLQTYLQDPESRISEASSTINTQLELHRAKFYNIHTVKKDGE